jgi:hypothetical protein
MRNSSNLAADLMLAAILGLGATGVWIVVMAFPTALLSTWLPNTFEDQLWLVIPALLSPLMVTLALLVYVPSRMSGYGSLGQRYYFLEHPAVLVSVCVLLAVSVILALRTYYRQRSISDRHAHAWAIFVFLWGVPGYIGYLAHRRWPVTERCSQCFLETPRDRDDCLHCHTPFPPPARVGTEIFA